MRIVEKIILAADRKGLSQAQVERKAGLPTGRISKWSSRPKSNPSGTHCVQVAEALSVPVEWLIDERVGGEPPSVTDDQLVLRVYHALGLTADEAIRGLNWASKESCAASRNDYPMDQQGESDAEPTRQSG